VREEVPLYSCEAFRAQLSNLVDDEVAVQVRRELERHLAECRVCEVLFDSTKKTLTILTDAGRFELPRDISERLTAKILASLDPAN
jgi:anti-sigma factor RsiW